MSRSDSTIDEQAAEWVTRLTDGEFDPEEPFPNLMDRNSALVEWASQSHEHQRAFLKMYETYRVVERIDLRACIRVEELLAKRNANVIPFPLRRRPS